MSETKKRGDKPSKAQRRLAKRRQIRMDLFNQRGAGKIADGMNAPGSGNRKK